MMEQTSSVIDVFDAGDANLISYFNDPQSAVIFVLGIFVSSIVLIAFTKITYGPKKKK